jgi:hypothetical protein
MALRALPLGQPAERLAAWGAIAVDTRARHGVINWDRCGELVICVLAPWQIQWLRVAIVDYRDRAPLRRDGADIRSLVGSLLADMPERDNVMVFRNEEHRIAWAWLLDALRSAADDLNAGVEDWSWLFELIDFLLTAGDRPVAGVSDDPLF